MAARSPEYVIILAGGKGSRMGSDTHKVCFDVDGIPVILRAVDNYKRCGIKQNIIVVGSLAGQVVKTVSAEFSNAVYVYQREQLGTANAVRCALDAMQIIPDEADLLLVAGDRLIKQAVLEKLFNYYYSHNLDLAFLGTERFDGSSQGRIVEYGKGVLGIIEMADIRQRRTLLKLRHHAEAGSGYSGTRMQKMLIDGFMNGKETDPAKLTAAFGVLWTEAVSGREFSAAELLSEIPEESTLFEFRINNRKIFMTPDEVEQSAHCNTSVYLIKVKALRYAMSRLDTKNAQQEEYLSDIVRLIKRRNNSKSSAVGVMVEEDHTKVLGFNDPAELLEVERIVKKGRRQSEEVALDSKYFRPLSEWENIVAEALVNPTRSRDFESELSGIYGSDREVARRQVSRYLPLLEFAAAKIGPMAHVGIVRSPGRLNVMGRHIDHQGGNCNLMTIGYETLMVVHPRNDDNVKIHNIDEERFQSAEFSISELVKDLPWEDWLSLVNSEKLRKMLGEYGVDWSTYIKAAFLRLQKKFPHRTLKGMDIFVSGNVPVAAGLSSSSSLVVGAAEAIVSANKLDTFPAQFVTLCGEGEWFVGTRGGSADHAAVKLGQRGKVVKVSFFDFAIDQIVEFPKEYVMAVCDSGIKACKSNQAKDQFNHRVCCYKIGFMLIKKMFPQYRPLLHHLRDVNTRNLRIPLSWIYRILLHLPSSATRKDIEAMLPDENLRELWKNHNPPRDGLYPVRGVVLFGLSEFERAAAYADLLKNGKVEEIGKLMQISHDGDRVSTRDESGKYIPWKAPFSNSYILKLIDDIESGEPERVIKAQLYNQSGSYHCSLTDIDRMVDIAVDTKGTAGAQLAGSGLGGCMMVLVRKNAVDGLIKNLKEKYYKPAGLETNILVCRPVAGAGMLELSGPA
ncbi:MAG: NTP transferase domain-containing protein [Lentisphaerae bacterium]|nr:NTP transferase domain-containing protein [Lentisphaerota bacterium]MCP4100832.1 NTP transferase domain-containing protein [Lentisphaerota bacterium]